jgi:predicted MFS family arabinose efflux permease
MTGMALFGISGLLSNPVSAFVGEQVLERAGAPWLFVASTVFFAVPMVMAARFHFHKPDSLTGRTRFLGLLARRQIWSLLFMALMMGGAFAIFSSFLANLSRERLGLVHISPFYIAFSAIALVVRLFFVQYLERMRGNLLAGACFACMALAFGLSWFLASPWLLVLMGMLYGLGSGILFPLLSTAIVNTGSDADRLGLNNLFSSVNTLGNIVLAILLGLVADQIGIPAIFLIMSGLMLLTVPVALTAPVRIKAG